MTKRIVLAVTIVLFIVSIAVGCKTTASTPPANGNTSKITATIVEPDDGVKPILEFIRQAKSTVDIEVYLLSERGVLDALKEAKQRGINVRVMLEEHPFGGGEGNATVFRQLRDAGINVKWSNPAFRFTHEKVIIVDRAAAAIMTLNITRSSFTQNREFAVIDNAPNIVAQVQAIFDADWERRAYKSSDPNLVVSPDNARGKLLDLIGNAQRSLDIYAEEMNEKTVEDALIKAVKRGVKVRVIMSAAQSTERDGNERGRANIRRAGADVRIVNKPYIHAKIILVDKNLAFVGSQNFSATSLDQNRELGLVVSNSSTLERIQTVFDKDWAGGR